MTRKRKQYYDKRQIIDVGPMEEIDFGDRILLCLPSFAWAVARAYLSEQAQWASSYSMEYRKEFYFSPDEAELDIIKANIDDALAEDDMSCDLVAAINGLQNALDLLVSKECCIGTQGSANAGATDAPLLEYDDDGINPPEGFTDYAEYDAFKCAVAGRIIDVFLTDLRWFLNTDVTGITATLLVATLLTPIPGDEIAVMVGGIAVMVVEGILDTILETIIADLEADRDELVCSLYCAINASEALQALEDWADAKYTGLTNTFVGWFLHSDVVNWLFSKVNMILGTEDCSACSCEQCAGTATKDTRYASETDFSFTEVDTTISITTLVNTAYGYRGAVRFIDGSTVCARNLVDIDAGSMTGGYINLKDENDAFMDIPGVGTQITAANLATAQAWLAANEPLVSAMLITYMDTSSTYDFIFV